MPEPQQISRKHRWKVQGRVAVLEYASAHGLKPAAERFGLDRKTVRKWRDRAKAAGEAGLVPRYPKRRPPDATVRLIEEARRELGWGACRIRLWLLRVHQIKVAAKTIARICVDLGLPRAQGAEAPRRAPRQLKLFEKATPGESVQVDVKVVTVNGTKAYQYRACDDCTRYRVLRLFPRLNTRTSVDFLAELRRVLPFSIQRVQTDHGTEFSFDFAGCCESSRITRFQEHKKARPKGRASLINVPSLTPDGERPADGNSYASRGPFARYCVGNIKCSYGVPGNMTYG